jgi:protein phosphatase
VIGIPSPSLVVLLGTTGEGPLALCAREFSSEPIVSAPEAIEEKLRARRLAVFDARALAPAARRTALAIGRRHHLPAVALVFQDGETRAPAVDVQAYAIAHRIRMGAAAVEPRLRTVPLPCDRGAEHGPFDLIGDVHGCAAELERMLVHLGYRRSSGRSPFLHPEGRLAVFVGDLVDRGPAIVDAAQRVMDMVESGTGLCIAGNHDDDLARTLQGDGPVPGPGTERSMRQIAAVPPAARRAFTRRFIRFVGSLPSHLLLDGGRLAVTHAAMRPDYLGRDSPAVRQFALRGPRSGVVDRYGLAARVNWAATYDGPTFVVYGHTPVRRPERIGNTLNIDTGCVFGGALSALRYPEMDLFSVPAGRLYYQSPRLLPSGVGIRAVTRITPRG